MYIHVYICTRIYICINKRLAKISVSKNKCLLLLFLWDFIPLLHFLSGSRWQFRKHNVHEGSVFGQPFDFNSVMMYSW